MQVARKDLYELQKITIAMGPGCNILCRHCIQNLAKGCEWNYKLSEEFLDMLVDWSRNVRPTRRLVFQKPMLLFYGGEPLLYYRQMQEIVEKLEAKGFDFGRIELKLFTNGLLLTDDKVEFFNRYGFNVVLSYDGPDEYGVRPVIASDKNIEVWKKIEKRGVTTCLTAYNPDFLKTKLWLARKFDTEDVSIEMIYINWNMPKEIYAFRRDYFDDQLRRIVMYYRQHRIDKSFLTFTKNYVRGVMDSYRNATFTVDGHVLNNRYNLEETDDVNSVHEYSCYSCKYKQVCPFSGKIKPFESDCELGQHFYHTYEKYRTELENLVKRDRLYLTDKKW